MSKDNNIYTRRTEIQNYIWQCKSHQLEKAHLDSQASIKHYIHVFGMFVIFTVRQNYVHNLVTASSLYVYF